MKKIYLLVIAAFFFLVVLIVLTVLINGKKTQNNQNPSVFPTTFPLSGSNKVKNITTPLPLSSNKIENIMEFVGTVENKDFKAQYSPSLNKVIVQEKTSQGQQSFYQWVKDNNLSNIINSADNVVFTKSEITPEILPTPTTPVDALNNKIKDFFDLLNLLYSTTAIDSDENQNNNPGQGTPIISPPIISPTTDQKNQGSNKVYYGQGSDQYGNITLPPNCLLRSCGCGPTSVAMIASSYISTDYNPQKIVDIYIKNNYSMCCGSYSGSAKSVLKSLGLKTTDYIINEYPPVAASEVTPVLKKYIDAGWTLFVLAYYRPNNGGGHYFWITDIDSSGNILAYDPYYGQGSSPPLNENKYSPFPEYAQVFGVKQ